MDYLELLFAERVQQHAMHLYDVDVQVVMSENRRAGRTPDSGLDKWYEDNPLEPYIERAYRQIKGLAAMLRTFEQAR